MERKERIQDHPSSKGNVQTLEIRTRILFFLYGLSLNTFPLIAHYLFCYMEKLYTRKFIHIRPNFHLLKIDKNAATCLTQSKIFLLHVTYGRNLPY